MKNGIAVKMDPQVPSDPSSKNCKDLDQKRSRSLLTKQLLSAQIFFTVQAFFEYSSVFIHFIKRNQPYIILFRLFDQAIRKSAF